MNKEKLNAYLERMQEIKDYIKSKGLDLDGKIVARYFLKRGWLIKGVPFVSIEQLVEHYIKVDNFLKIRQERNKNRREKRKEKKKIIDKQRKDEYFRKLREERKGRVEIAIKKKTQKERDSIINMRRPLSYEEQLVDKRWKEFREKVLNHNGKKCENCGSVRNLQIHHPRYIEGHYAWEYGIDEVVVLCDKCHKLMHSIN